MIRSRSRSRRLLFLQRSTIVYNNILVFSKVTIRDLPMSTTTTVSSICAHGEMHAILLHVIPFEIHAAGYWFSSGSPDTPNSSTNKNLPSRYDCKTPITHPYVRTRQWRPGHRDTEKFPDVPQSDGPFF